MFLTIFFAVIQQSIIPLMSQVEEIDSLPQKKFEKSQWEEISKVLSHKDEAFRVMTYNMLFTYYDHNLAPEYRWPARLPRVVEVIEDAKADIIGFQELEKAQLDALLPKIENTYAVFQNSPKRSEIDGIFFNKHRFSLIRGEVWSMSNSKDLTMALLEDLKTKQTVAVFNLHFSYSNIEKRAEEVRFVKENILSFAKGNPILLMGDWNTFPAWLDASFPAFDGTYIEKEMAKTSLQDSYLAATIGHIGPYSTFTNQPNSQKVEPFKGTGTPGVILDHIYVSNEVSVLVHAINPALVDGYFPSDHMPVLIDCFISSKEKKIEGKSLANN